jgi:23S rRNA (adenine2030-N6)-methyltransferase
LNYRHGFHAGNAADVFKHVVLTWLLSALTAKDKPLLYFETHAGAGRYDLTHYDPDGKGEWHEGIARLWTERDAPETIAAYLDIVRAGNRGALRHYPGSPLIAHTLLRPGDRMVLCETVREEAEALYRGLPSDRRAEVHGEDGYRILKAQLPPPERRALVLIDPPYESPGEFERAVSALREMHARFPTGVYALWYPIKQPAPVRRLHEALIGSGIRRILAVELAVWPEDTAWRLNGSGLILVNPPWPAAEALPPLLEWLRPRLACAGPGRSKVEWLVPE